MADLEAKLLDGAAAGYCSSSDDDEEHCSKSNSKSFQNVDERVMPRNQRNTGPKGVLEDYRICKEEQKQEQLKIYERIIAHAKEWSLSGETKSDDLELLRKQRLQEMKDCLYAKGKVDELTKKEQFLDYIESNHGLWILIHIYDGENEGCVTLNKVFNTLILRYPNLKLAKVLPSVIGMSSQFKENALPALQAYRNEVLRGNFVRLTDQLGEQFTAEQLIHFLNENEIDLEMLDCPANTEDNCSNRSFSDED